MSVTTTAQIRVAWDSYARSHYWVLSGTSSLLDGTVLAIPEDRRPFREQAASNIAAINARRFELGRSPICIAGI